MPLRPHTNTCNATLSALENMRDMDQAELFRQAPHVQRYAPALAGWKRGSDLGNVPGHDRVLELAREWAEVYVLDDLSQCDCDARYVHVIARRWHLGHATTAPARVIARVTPDGYVVQFLTGGPGQPEQVAFRRAIGVAPDDVATLDSMEITTPPPGA